jgi:acyl-CoA dehydrogenase
LAEAHQPSPGGHFTLPFNASGLQLVETWDAPGMRGTGSHNVTLDNVFVPDEAIVARRPVGTWHPLWNVVLPTALPLISSAYVGMAEAAASMAIESAQHKQTELAPVVGEMINALSTCRVKARACTGVRNDREQNAVSPVRPG